jgi:hypothetical protein
MLDGHDYASPIGTEPTVGEIVDSGLFIRVTCSCGHEREMSPASICIGRKVTLDTLASSLTCSRCRTKGLNARVSGKPLQ